MPQLLRCAVPASLGVAVMLIILSTGPASEGADGPGNAPRHAATGTKLSSDFLAPWKQGVKITPVSRVGGRHTIHSYYVASPESPDGRQVLFFASTAADAHTGDICIVERSSGHERVLAREVTVEDAHRVACQQWLSGGRWVVFHDLRKDGPVVVAVDVATGKERLLARGRQVGFGSPQGDLIPLYGPHWDPNAFRDLEVLQVETGKVQTVVTVAAVKAAYREAIAQVFGERPISIYFPVLSPDQKRVFFKLAAPLGGDVRSKQASQREFLIGYDLEKSRFLFMQRRWGHPAWHPDSRTILNVPNVLIDSETGEQRSIPDLPAFPGSHPSVSPDGKLFVTDLYFPRETTNSNKGPFEWGVAVADLRGKDSVLLHRFDHSRGASSWRRSHPHPVFSTDGKRIYYNVAQDEWNRLYVATIDEEG